MSGIYISGMEMPTSCDMCWALDDYGDYPRCRIIEEQRGYNFPIREKRMDNCPLVPVPEHGQMTNADRIRAMNNEELAKWIWRETTIGGFAVCPPGTKDGACPTSDCDSCWLGWLESPVDKEAEK